MEKFALTLESQPAIDAYLADSFVSRDEMPILLEIGSAISSGDIALLAWFAGFGDSFRQILMNVKEHRRALEFGFTEIAFNRYGWFSCSPFLDRETIGFEQSEIRIGRGPNGLWVYALRCNYGVAGDSGPLSVFCKQYPSREAVLDAALAELKMKISRYVGNSDTTNYKQDVLNKTLKAIAAYQVDRVQLSLF
ncbi:hypothetical protein [Mucilaginibacter defluvii]